MGDILATGFTAVERADVQPGDTVVVTGGGPVGAMTVLCAQRRGASVMVVDPDPRRRRAARGLGARAEHPGDVPAKLASWTDGYGADVAVAASGSPRGLDMALAAVRGRGTVVVVGAHFEPDYPLDAGSMFDREVTLRFTIGDPTHARERLLRLIAAGTLDPTVVLSHRLPPTEAAEGYRLFDSREATKVLLTP